MGQDANFYVEDGERGESFRNRFDGEKQPIKKENEMKV